jgi:hypothetical protein
VEYKYYRKRRKSNKNVKNSRAIKRDKLILLTYISRSPTVSSILKVRKLFAKNTPLVPESCVPSPSWPLSKRLPYQLLKE